MTPSSARPPVSAFLGPLGTEVLERVRDVRVRARAFRAVSICDEALKVVDALDLSPHEIQGSDGRDLSVWNAVAPQVRELLVTVGRASRVLQDLFSPIESPADEAEPASVDLELALSTMEHGEPPGPIRDRRELEIDRLVERTTDVVLCHDIICQLASMLAADFHAFATRLRNPAVVSDRWLLLAELQELKSKCTQCLEAIVASIIQPLTDQPLHIILPRYADATARAVLLRSKLVDLARDIAVLNQKVKGATHGQALPVRHAIAVRLEEFIDHAAYEYLRPADKRELSKFRIDLKSYEQAIENLSGFRALVDGLSVFLDVLRAINQRDQLVQHDLQTLRSALVIAEAGGGGSDLLTALRPVLGRNTELDEYIRALRRGLPVDRKALIEVVEKTEALLAAGC